ncbi:MAG TPA: energy transducer TonB [Pyrinomonadaceae bacterium]|nr:energy transducer TonB [Pyrinomonadaceae bacterium]
MPLNVRRFFTSVFITLLGTSAYLFAQAPQPTRPVQAQAQIPTPITTVEKQPTSADVMRERISKAKAFIAVRNYNAAIYELENIRRETSDQSVNAVTNVLLMNTYLEQSDYKRAQDFLNEFYKAYKSNNARGNLYYAAVAAQVIKGSRSQVERYRALGLNVSDRNLPLEAVNDIERMRETLELVITQAKDLGADKTKSSAAMALIEEATNSRSMIARDEYDARRWKDALGDSREDIASSQSVVINAVDGAAVPTPTPTLPNTVAMNNPPASNPPTSTNNSTPQTVFKPVTEIPQNTKRAETPTASNNRPNIQQPVQQPQQQAVNEPQRNRVIDNKPTVEVPVQAAAKTGDAAAPGGGALDVGSLIVYATKQQAPTYPPAAKSMRTMGVVKVEVTVDETGGVAEVQKASGPMLLQAAAKDAIRKWKFKPFTRDGQPVKATGFVNFNFSL